MAVAIYDADPRVQDSKILNAAVASATSTEAALAASGRESHLCAVVIDGNLGKATAVAATELARAANAVCVLEPVSEPKAGSEAAAALLLSGEIDVATPNRGELRAMAKGVRAAGWKEAVTGTDVDGSDSDCGNDDIDLELRALCATVLSAMASRGPSTGAGKGKHLLVTEGEKGVVLASLDNEDDEDAKGQTLTFERFRVPPVTTVVSATGAGDTFLAGTMCGLVSTMTSATTTTLRASLRHSIPFGLVAARETLGSTDAVATTLNWESLEIEVESLRRFQRQKRKH